MNLPRRSSIPMHFLVTNDDGIDCVFLHVLVHALQKAGHRTSVSAPLKEQSWIGAAKSRHRPVMSAAVDKGFQCPTWVVDGTPSDCVNIALNHFLTERPDAVVSGMNVGFNASLGFIVASGTIGGAWEGALHGLPAVAVSQDLLPHRFEEFRRGGDVPDAELRAQLQTSAARVAQLVPELVAKTAQRTFVVHNLNIPNACRADTAAVQTVPSRLIVPSLFSKRGEDGHHRFVFQRGEEIPLPPGSPKTDRVALSEGLISHSILDYTRIGG